MTSNNLSTCCITGTLHEGEPKGTIQDIENISTYITHPPTATKKAILLLTDVIGHRFLNAQLLADQFAAAGYLVLMPDLFTGDSVPLNRPEGFQIMEWAKGHQPAHTDPIIQTALNHIRSTLGCERVGGVGYCFGGKYVARFLKVDGGLDVGFTAHPTMMTAEELAAVEGPFCVAAAQHDPIFSAEKRRESEEILGKKDQPWQISVYSDVEHGFAVRGDPAARRVRFAKEQAFQQAVAWFGEYL
ncbi:alpha/beta-hydrolase [Aspergillus brunneoviolaceus CBS 621.78]|uniref:Alpha/beta-hydrolase n=2 Tax=Aspergillus TaxID=5052 RepID=A0A8G1RUS6_9EURO|nr:alpha/beta-hydrolase [Aspergillus brunneoviolaceus CBS 621.78]XP_040803087.1 alpha/beta-hydrolase [Aspergillus fijiensis CBS 313.89]RAH49638.1 alpha/beta-hydrolase [Aspergillus brunneoviolaceus CBS 621.78]RAK79077.1 alpha/beta-hydrolase [Aspergillus fijiensis CBS 313.89]